MCSSVLARRSSCGLAEGLAGSPVDPFRARPASIVARTIAAAMKAHPGSGDAESAAAARLAGRVRTVWLRGRAGARGGARGGDVPRAVAVMGAGMGRVFRAGCGVVRPVPDASGRFRAVVAGGRQKHDHADRHQRRQEQNGAPARQRPRPRVTPASAAAARNRARVPGSPKSPPITGPGTKPRPRRRPPGRRRRISSRAG